MANEDFYATQINMAMADCAEATRNLQTLLAQACPGIHDPVQHRDGKPAWCSVCHVPQPCPTLQSLAGDAVERLKERDAAVLNDAADSLEGRLGTEGAPRTLWEFRAYLRARAKEMLR